MTVAKWVTPNYTVDTASAYKANIDACHAVAKRVADWFAPRANDTPNMKVRLDAGYLFDGATLTEVASQETATITAPVGNPRIDRIVIDQFTGAVSVITGTPASSPVAPAITAGKFPIAQVLLQTSSTSIANSMITDERVLAGGGGGGAVSTVTAITGNTTLTAADVGKTIHLSANDINVTLPALSAVPIGASFEFVSTVATDQRIYPAGAELLEGANDYYRVPSYEAVRIRKISASTWRIVSKPQHGVGESIEWCGTAGTLLQVLGQGYIDENGQAVSRTTYKNLFAVISTTWGAGDGSTTFNVPDARGRSTIGYGQGSSLTMRSVGQYGGEEYHTITINEMPYHGHSGTSGVDSPDHQHYSYSDIDTRGGSSPYLSYMVAGVTANLTSGATARHYHSIPYEGASWGHNTMHPFLVKRKFIKC